MVNLNNKISLLIDKELRKLGDKNFTESRNRLIGKNVISYGVRTREIRKVAKKYFGQFQGGNKENWLKIIKELMATRVFENQMAGIFLLGDLIKTERKVVIFEIENLIEKYIDNWATCDTMSSEVTAKILKRSPEGIGVLDDWVKSKNIWLKRAALVTMVKFKGKIENWQEIASRMLSFSEKEKEPILKKAVHWLEKKVLQ